MGSVSGSVPLAGPCGMISMVAPSGGVPVSDVSGVSGGIPL